jgi:hypothetical protein
METLPLDVLTMILELSWSPGMNATLCLISKLFEGIITDAIFIKRIIRFEKRWIFPRSIRGVYSIIGEHIFEKDGRKYITDIETCQRFESLLDVDALVKAHETQIISDNGLTVHNAYYSALLLFKRVLRRTIDKYWENLPYSMRPRSFVRMINDYSRGSSINYNINFFSHSNMCMDPKRVPILHLLEYMNMDGSIEGITSLIGMQGIATFMLTINEVIWKDATTLELNDDFIGFNEESLRIMYENVPNCKKESIICALCKLPGFLPVLLTNANNGISSKDATLHLVKRAIETGECLHMITGYMRKRGSFGDNKELIQEYYASLIRNKTPPDADILATVNEHRKCEEAKEYASKFDLDYIQAHNIHLDTRDLISYLKGPKDMNKLSDAALFDVLQYNTSLLSLDNIESVLAKITTKDASAYARENVCVWMDRNKYVADLTSWMDLYTPIRFLRLHGKHSSIRMDREKICKMVLSDLDTIVKGIARYRPHKPLALLLTDIADTVAKAAFENIPRCNKKSDKSDRLLFGIECARVSSSRGIVLRDILDNISCPHCLIIAEKELEEHL